MNIVCVIPARAESSRFFEKPLALILGKPMIRWVWEHCKEVEQFSEVYVATDSEKIKALAESFGAKVVMTCYYLQVSRINDLNRVVEIGHKVRHIHLSLTYACRNTLRDVVLSQQWFITIHHNI